MLLFQIWLTTQIKTGYYSLTPLYLVDGYIQSTAEWIKEASMIKYWGMVSTFYTIFTLQMKSHFCTLNDDLINENNWYPYNHCEHCKQKSGISRMSSDNNDDFSKRDHPKKLKKIHKLPLKPFLGLKKCDQKESKTHMLPIYGLLGFGYPNLSCFRWFIFLFPMTTTNFIILPTFLS